MSKTNFRQQFLDFYAKRGHAIIPSSSLLPENDASTLFTSSGMQPLLPYFLGTPHPQGRRIADAQKCFRAVDIEEVGDNRHTTFFEMLGNWSFGDYFKTQQLTWIWEFFTQVVGLDPRRLCVTVFAGEPQLQLARDDESIHCWQELFASRGLEAKLGERIFAHDAHKNWWSRSGTPDQMPPGEPGGTDSEIFYDFGAELGLHEHSPWADQPCHPNCDCGRFIEIGNSVFMQYQKQADGTFCQLPQRNVDYGGGLERLLMAAEHQVDIFQTSSFQPLIQTLQRLSGQSYTQLSSSTRRAWRIITDHIRSAVFLMSDGLTPSNKDQGYVLRRLIRRSLVQAQQAGLPATAADELLAPLVEQYQTVYPALATRQREIGQTLADERTKFTRTLERGLRQINKLTTISGEQAFFLYESYGFPFELTREIAAERGLSVDEAAFRAAQKNHQAQSQAGARGKFRGGLADHETQTVKFHTASHLLLAALRQLIDPDIYQKGSNITGERARFDFSLNRALTPSEIERLQQQVNDWIAADLPVRMTEYDKATALELVGGSVFADRYPQRVSVYQIGEVSREICVGPHVTHTSEIGPIRLTKHQSAGAGARRLYIYSAT